MSTFRCALCWLLPALAGACALSAPPASETLSREIASGGANVGAVDEIDRLATLALAVADAEPNDVKKNVLAARRLFQAADLRLQAATVAWLQAHPSATCEEALLADDQLDDAVRRDVVSLCTRGLEVADRAANLAPDDVSARLHQALHVSLLAWANGAVRSLMAGFGPRLVQSIDEALRLDATFEGGAPLRLQGRFRGRAPWPYGDIAVAREALARAVACASVPVNHLFFGDLLATVGEWTAAREQWQLASEAHADETTHWSASLLQELARVRLRACTAKS